MANTVSSFYQTLVAATEDASQALVGPNAYLDAVYLDYKPEAASIGQTLNVAIPASVTSSVADEGVADPTFTDISFTTAAITFNKHPAFNYIIRDFEQFNSPLAIRQIFLDAAIKGVAENIDTTVAALFTTSNITTNSAITGTGSVGGSGKSVAVADVLKGQANLLGQKVPVNDVQNMTLIMHPIPYTRVLQDTNWTQESIVSAEIASRVRNSGQIRTGYGATIAHDLFTPSTGTVGARTFTASYFHRWSVAVATRPLPPPDGKVADYMYMMYKGVPLRITLAWSVVKNGYCVLVEAGYGCAVVRENMAQLITSTE